MQGNCGLRRNCSKQINFIIFSPSAIKNRRTSKREREIRIGLGDPVAQVRMSHKARQ